MKKLLKWLVSHLFVRTVDLQARRDDVAYDETKPHTAVEVGIKGTF